MDQVETISIPVSARRNVLLTRLSRGAGFVAAVAIGLKMNKLPAEKIATAAAIFCSMEVVTAGLNAFDDKIVAEEMVNEQFGHPQEKLEAAGVGLGIGFAAVVICMTAVKLMKKGKENEQNTE